MSDTRTKILDFAEEAVCKGGTGAFSFRTIADALDIKSSSVHYHFENKDDLICALAERYHREFFDLIGEPVARGGLKRYFSAFQEAIGEGDGACFCGVLAGEYSLLSEKVRDLLGNFQGDNLQWLESLFRGLGEGAGESQRKARLVFSSLEGAILFSRVQGAADYLNQVIRDLKKDVG